jgi:hypothetical protein
VSATCGFFFVSFRCLLCLPSTSDEPGAGLHPASLRRTSSPEGTQAIKRVAYKKKAVKSVAKQPSEDVISLHGTDSEVERSDDNHGDKEELLDTEAVESGCEGGGSGEDQELFEETAEDREFIDECVWSAHRPCVLFLKR